MENKHTFQVVEDLVMENSFGVLHSQDQVTLEVTIGFNNAERGWFELYDIESGGNKWHAEGMLCFTDKVLTEYDGVFELLPCILDKLEELGYDCSEMR
jgi:hypothetical protein